MTVNGSRSSSIKGRQEGPNGSGSGGSSQGQTRLQQTFEAFWKLGVGSGVGSQRVELEPHAEQDEGRVGMHRKGYFGIVAEGV